MKKNDQQHPDLYESIQRLNELCKSMLNSEGSLSPEVQNAVLGVSTLIDQLSSGNLQNVSALNEFLEKKNPKEVSAILTKMQVAWVGSDDIEPLTKGERHEYNAAYQDVRDFLEECARIAD